MSNIKKCFVSRFGSNGVILEADYSQIEVVVQAFLSGDKQMKQDVKDAVDFHCKRLAYKLQEDYSLVLHKCIEVKDPEYVKMRKHIKVFSFQRAYGAGVNLIACTLGISKRDVQGFVDAENALYPNVAKMQERWIQEVRESSKILKGERSKKDNPIHVGHIKSITGKRYIFKEEDVPTNMQTKWVDGKQVKRLVDYKPTKIKNYPVQGLAGELLYLALAKLNRFILNDTKLFGKCILINTVHDSILFDIHKDVLEYAKEQIKRIMEEVPKYFEETFNTEFDLPLRVDLEYGPSWLEKS